MLKKEELRSYKWFGSDSLRSFGHRSRIKQMGFLDSEYQGKPIIGIINPWNELNTCHTHFPERVNDIKRGVLSHGGFPVEIPVMSLGEQLIKPTAMLFRNFLAMEVEEIIRAHPVDGVVVLGGCDKTTPGVIMGAISAGYPMIYVPGGAMRRAAWRGESLGSGSDVWKYWEEKRANNITNEEWLELENSMAMTPGTCMSMGTAATMMSVADALGACITGASSIPAVDANHQRMASQSGRLIVDLVWCDIKPQDLFTRQSFTNAIKVCCAIGGSTNAIIHIIAMANRAGITITLDDFDAIAKDTPLLANVKPTGMYVMEDFYFAGGLKALMWQLKDLLDLQTKTVNFNNLGANIEGSAIYNNDVIYNCDAPIQQGESLVVLKGNLAINGCALKPHAMDKKFLKHEGRAVVFDSIKAMKLAFEDSGFDVEEDDVLVLKYAGPKSRYAMPEWGQLPLPKKLVQKGVRDMLRISDARMSGTSYGACVLHVSPDASSGGTLAVVENGDRIMIDVAARRIELLVSDTVIEQRKAQLPQRPTADSGYLSLFTQQVEQADVGCDFAFLRGNRTKAEPFID